MSEQQVVSAEEVAVAVRGVRAVVGVIADSLIPTLDRVTMPQFRALVLLRALGPLPAGALAARLGVTASTGTRLVARLVRGGWVERTDDPADRRLISISLTERGAALVDETRGRREAALVTILRRVSATQRAALLSGLALLADASGEPAPEALGVLAFEHGVDA